MSSQPTPFKLVSAALYQARHPRQETTYANWRTLLKRFEGYRGAIDPVADQSANLDVLLRSMEDDIEAELIAHGNLNHEAAGFQLHLHLSRLWVFGTYEFLRTLHCLVKVHSHPEATCMKKSDSKGCGRASCVPCAIGHIKNEATLVRIALAKNDIAGDVKNPPLTEEMRQEINAEPEANRPPVSRFLCDGEGQIGGAMAWYVLDKRVDRYRVITRRDLSDRVLRSLDAVDVKAPTQPR